jgi:transcriptional regulator with XRE-family HTH domain
MDAGIYCVVMTFKQLRQATGFPTQVALAEKTGIDQSTISSLENGETMPKSETLERLAKAFGVPMAKVLEVLRTRRRNGR